VPEERTIWSGSAAPIDRYSGQPAPGSAPVRLLALARSTRCRSDGCVSITHACSLRTRFTLWLASSIVLALGPALAPASEGTGFTFDPPAGFVEIKGAKTNAAVLAQFGLQSANGTGSEAPSPHRVWIHERTPPSGPDASLLLLRLATSPRPAEDERFAEGFRRSFEQIARGAGAQLQETELQQLEDGAPYWQCLLEVQVEGRPIAMRYAALPRRDFELRIILRSTDPEGLAADWQAVLGRLRMDAPAPSASTRTVDRDRFLRGLRIAAILVALIVLYRWFRHRKAKGPDSSTEPGTQPPQV
jgi:hypothetical protein